MKSECGNNDLAANRIASGEGSAIDALALNCGSISSEPDRSAHHVRTSVRICHSSALMLRQFNAKAPGWLNPLRGTTWSPARLLMPRSLFMTPLVQDCWKRFTSNASRVSWRHAKFHSSGRSDCRSFTEINGSKWVPHGLGGRRVGRRGGSRRPKRSLPVHEAQLVTYLKLSGYQLGLLINFNVVLIKYGIRRRVRQLTTWRLDVRQGAREYRRGVPVRAV